VGGRRVGRIAFVALTALLLAAFSVAQEQPTFNINVRLVRLLVTVKDNYGAPVGGLKPAEFQVYDNGVRQEIKLFEPHTEQPLSLSLLIDTSGSTAKDLRYETDSVRRFLRAVVRQGNTRDAATIYSFNYDILHVIDFTRNLARVEAALKGLKAEGGTSMYDALYYSAPELGEREGRHAMIMITDGGDTTSNHRFQQAVEAVHRADAVVYAILVMPITNDAGRNIGGENALYTLAASTGGRVFTPSDSASLDEAFAQILSELRTQYLVGYYPKDVPPSRERFHRLEVKLNRPGLHVSSRTGYYEGSDQPSGPANRRGWPSVH
jgi:Ca-activated chloride channel family protein